MVLAETFGISGTGASFFGGAWWLVGLLLIVLMVAFLAAYRVNAEGITIFTVLALLFASGYQIFVISEQITQTILFIIFMFVAFVAYLFFSR